MTDDMKKLITIIAFLLPMLAQAQQMNVSVDSVGMLGKELPDSVRFKVAELKITGPLNGADLKLLSQIVTRTRVNKKVPGECLVTSVDMSEAVIREGKEGMRTENNTMPNGLFAGAKALVKAIGDTLPGARLSVSCDLTKLHELTLRGTPEAILQALEANEKSEKGEYCVVADLRGVNLPEEKPVAQSSLEARLFDRVLAGRTLREAVAELTAQGEKKNAVYAASLRVKDLLG